MSKKVRLGIVGIGNQGSNYARLIVEGRVPNIELVAIVDTAEIARTRSVSRASIDRHLERRPPVSIAGTNLPRA